MSRYYHINIRCVIDEILYSIMGGWILLRSLVPQKHLAVLWNKLWTRDESWFLSRCESNSCCHHWICIGDSKSFFNYKESSYIGDAEERSSTDIRGRNFCWNSLEYFNHDSRSEKDFHHSRISIHIS